MPKDHPRPDLDPRPHKQQKPGEQRARLADAISRRHRDIEHRWIEEVKRSLAGAAALSRSELRDSMPEYLERLANGLRESNTAQAGGSSSWENVAREHAVARVRVGFDIDQLIREFVILRQVLFRTIEEEEGAVLEVRQYARLADLIDGAIEAAVKSYVEWRDFQARKQEAEHIGFLTHELRNPLTTAMLGTAQLNRTLSLSPEQIRTFAIVERNLRRLAELIDGVLLVEKNVHAFKPEPTVVTLMELLDQPLAAAKLASSTKGLHLDARFDPNTVVYADPKLSVSAIDNILQNAVKYTDAGDIQLVVEDAPDVVIIHVRDSCKGLSKAELRTIFEPFRRGGHAKTPGAGLGLAIARRAIEVQGGTIHAESGEEKGCHFWLTLRKPRH